MFQRHAHDKVLLGVCGGLAATLALRGVWVRVAFVILALASGVGVVLYVLLSLVMQPPELEQSPIFERVRANLRVYRHIGRLCLDALRKTWVEWTELRTDDDPIVQIRALIGGGVMLAGLFILLASFGLFGWLTFWRTLALLMLLMGFGLARAHNLRATPDDPARSSWESAEAPPSPWDADETPSEDLA